MGTSGVDKRIAVATRGSTGHTWIQSTQRDAEAAPPHLVGRAVPPDHNGCTPQPNDEIAVPGFRGTTWYTGCIVAVDLTNRKRPYKAFFAADSSYSDLALLPKNYGPATATASYGDSPEHVVGGWYLSLIHI